jgi:recombination protein U
MPGGGIIPQKRGASFEKTVKQLCDILKAQNIAWITKKATDTGFKPEKRNPGEKYNRKKAFKADEVFFRKKSTVDYEGFDASGRHVCFECKNTKNIKSWTYDYSKCEHQIRHLYNAWKQGCYAFVLIKNGRNKIYKVVPDESWDSGESIKINFKDHIELTGDIILDFIYVSSKWKVTAVHEKC